jgi:hypothetical protein
MKKLSLERMFKMYLECKISGWDLMESVRKHDFKGFRVTDQQKLELWS